MMEAIALATAIGAAAYVVFRFVPPHLGGFDEARAAAPARETDAKPEGSTKLDRPHRNT